MAHLTGLIWFWSVSETFDYEMLPVGLKTAVFRGVGRLVLAPPVVSFRVFRRGTWHSQKNCENCLPFLAGNAVVRQANVLEIGASWNGSVGWKAASPDPSEHSTPGPETGRRLGSGLPLL